MTAPTRSLYDVAINDLEFMFATDADNPMIRETVPYTKNRLDQAEDAGEQTLTAWWVKSQESFHGGAGQLNLEPPDENAVSHTRYLISKGVDPFTPGKLKPLPRTNTMIADVTASDIVSVRDLTDEWVCYISSSGGTAHVFGLTTTGVGGNLSFTGYTGTPQSLASDGANLYVACQSSGGSSDLYVYQYSPNSPSTATLLISGPIPTIGISRTPILSWQKSRLMMAFGPIIYELDVSSTGLTFSSTQIRYQHPVDWFQWRCFASSPYGILAAGDAGGESAITSLSLESSSGSPPTLVAAGDVASLPPGEHVLSMLGAQGSFLAVGTDRGIRIGTFDTYTGSLSLGPLTLDLTQPTIPCNAIVARDRFIYAFGQSYDEAGAITLDLGTQVDQAGRFAWAPGIIGSTFSPGAQANSALLLNRTNLLVYAVADPTYGGIFAEAVTGTSARTCWLQTSHIRYGTTEPKLFKRLRVKGESTTSSDIVEVTYQTEATSPITLTYPDPTHVYAGFPMDAPDHNFEVDLPGLDPAEWLTLTFTLLGSADCTITSYGLKALPATPRERHIQLTLSIADSETTRSGQSIRNKLSSRGRLAALEALDAAGQEVVLTEYTPDEVIATNAVIEAVSYKQVGRPTKTSDLGGQVTVLLRTVDT